MRAIARLCRATSIKFGARTIQRRGRQLVERCLSRWLLPLEVRNLIPRRQRGQSLVEFAFTLVIVLILLVGVIDLGRAIFTYLALRDAAQEGASFAAYNPTDTVGIQNRVRNASNTVSDLWVNPGITVQVTLIGNPCSGNGVRVRVLLSNFTLVTPFLGAIVGSQTIPISAAVTDTILSPPCQ